MDLKKWKIFQKLDPVFAGDVRRAYLTGINSSYNDWITGDDLYGGAVMVMKNGDLYSIALTCDSIELLCQETVKSLLPLIPVKFDELCGKEIRDISSGYNHIAALTADGRIYEWGPTCSKEKPTVLLDNLSNQQVIQIACGECHTLALTQEGEVFSWGENDRGQLGIGNKTNQAGPVKVSGLNGFDKTIVSVVCGGWTSFALDNEGNVWSWGDYEEYALGYEPFPSGDQLFPKMVSVSNIRKIAAGNTHVLALSTANDLYFWGQHSMEDAVRTPLKIEMENVVDIGAVRGCGISAFKTSDRRVFFWGYAYGHDIPDPIATNFTSMKELFASLDNPVMLKPVELEQRPPAMMEKFKEKFDDKDSGDIRFIVDGCVIYAHKAVLKIRSDYFQKMFENNWKESTDSEGVFQITDFPYQSFRTFLLYLYTERVEPPLRNSEEAIELFKLADYYGEEDLKQRCEQQLKLLTNEDNVCDLYSIAVQYNVESLHDAAMDIIIPNLNAVLKCDGYKHMQEGLKDRLIQELVDEELFVGLKRKRKE